jgi:hypothetical protein
MPWQWYGIRWYLGIRNERKCHMDLKKNMALVDSNTILGILMHEHKRLVNILHSNIQFFILNGS